MYVSVTLVMLDDVTKFDTKLNASVHVKFTGVVPPNAKAAILDAPVPPKRTLAVIKGLRVAQDVPL